MVPATRSKIKQCSLWRLGNLLSTLPGIKDQNNEEIIRFFNYKEGAADAMVVWWFKAYMRGVFIAAMAYYFQNKTKQRRTLLLHKVNELDVKHK